MDDILLATNDLISMLHEVKQFLFKQSDMKDLDVAFFFLELKSTRIDLELIKCFSKMIH